MINIDLDYNSHKHLIMLSNSMGMKIEDVLNIVIKNYILLGSMSFKDREKLKRLILKYESPQPY